MNSLLTFHPGNYQSNSDKVNFRIGTQKKIPNTQLTGKQFTCVLSALYISSETCCWLFIAFPFTSNMLSVLIFARNTAANQRCDLMCKICLHTYMQQPCRTNKWITHQGVQVVQATQWVVCHIHSFPQCQSSNVLSSWCINDATHWSLKQLHDNPGGVFLVCQLQGDTAHSSYIWVVYFPCYIDLLQQQVYVALVRRQLFVQNFHSHRATLPVGNANLCIH